jgi:hypothetical protein
MADRLAEIYQGKYGLMNIANPVFTFSDDNPITFIKEPAQWAENTRTVFNPEDTHLLGEWDSVISTIYRAT